MAEFEAKITGIADLSKAKQDFETFKKSMEQPIKITVDASGFNAVWGSLQRQAQQTGANIGQQVGRSIQNNIKNANLKIDPKAILKTGYDPIGDYLKMDSKLADDLISQLNRVKAEGGQLQSLKIGNGGSSFEAIIKNGDTAVKVFSQLTEEMNAFGQKTGNMVWNTPRVETVVNYANAIKQTQQEADKLGQTLDKVSKSFITGTFDANIAKMEQGLMNIGNSVESNLVKKASDAAAEYYKITQEITASLNGTSRNPLQGQQLADAYKQSEVALKSYNNAMIEVRANTQKMLAEGVGARNANQVETWAKNNSKALKQYGDQLQDLANKMRNAQTQGELNGYINQFKNLKAEITAAGQGGMSFGDQLKRAFVHIGEFTGIYAITSQIRQLPQEMVQEVIKIDTAMTELRKVSTASASEISNYFDSATESARKYGQTVDEVIDATASWTRLGYNLEDAKTLTDVTAELAQVGSGLTVDTASEGLQATLRGFAMTAEQAKYAADAINMVADHAPIDALGIINGLERSSAVMRETNNSLEETIGLITATTSVTQDATSAGTAWRTNKTVLVYRNMHRRTHLKPVKPKASLLQCG